MTIPILFSLLSIFLTLLHPSSGDTLPEDIFILAGESNMAGWGGVTGSKWNGYVPPQCRPNPSILRLSAHFTWSEAADPLHADIDVNHVCGVGPGTCFASAIKSKDPKLGWWGSCPAPWVAPRSRNGPAGPTWESDTVVRADAKAYKRNMEKLIRDIRTDLNNPSLPIIQVALASGKGKFVNTVRRAQLGITPPNVKCVDAKGLDLKTDHLHLTTTSQHHLGSLLADAFLASQ
ncbi:hypothetical protein NL676_024889 [Syzygium grande]|nr:hypothetical protein NL676_024889 [Syzygium grande]